MEYPSEKLELTVGLATKMTWEGMVCEFNLFWLEMLYIDLQVIERTHFLYPPGNLLNILLLYSCYFPLPLTQELISMKYTIL